MEPPDVQELTDEDSGNEDDETQRGPENLSGNQLRAPADFGHRNIEDEFADDMDDNRSSKTKRTSEISIRKDQSINSLPYF